MKNSKTRGILIMFLIAFVGFGFSIAIGAGTASADINGDTNTTNITGTVSPALTGLNISAEQSVGGQTYIAYNETYIDDQGNVKYKIEIYENQSTKIDIENQGDKINFRSTILDVDQQSPFEYNINSDVNQSDTYSTYGYIENQADQNISNVSVSLKFEGEVVQSTETNETGYYEFTGLNSSYDVTKNSTEYTIDRVEPAYDLFTTQNIGYVTPTSIDEFDPDQKRIDVTYEEQTYNLTIDVPTNQVKIGESIEFTANVSGATGVEPNNISYAWYVDTIEQSETSQKLNYTFETKGTHQVKLVSDVPNYGEQTAIVSGDDNWSEEQGLDVTNLTINVFNKNGTQVIPDSVEVTNATLRSEDGHTSEWVLHNLSIDHTITVTDSEYDEEIVTLEATELSAGTNETRNITLTNDTEQDLVVIDSPTGTDRPILVRPSSWGEYVLKIPAIIVNVGQNIAGAGAGIIGGVLGGVVALVAVIGIGSLLAYGGGNFLLWLYAVSKPFRIFRRIRKIISNGISESISSITDLFDWF